jgi:hypothetical protein
MPRRSRRLQNGRTTAHHKTTWREGVSLALATYATGTAPLSWTPFEYPGDRGMRPRMDEERSASRDERSRRSSRRKPFDSPRRVASRRSPLRVILESIRSRPRTGRSKHEPTLAKALRALWRRTNDPSALRFGKKIECSKRSARSLKNGGLLRERKSMKFGFIDAEKVNHSVSDLCHVLCVSRSGYYASKTRPLSRHACEDARIAALLVAAFRLGRGAYGSPRVLKELRERGERTSRKRVARLMSERLIFGRIRRRWRSAAATIRAGFSEPNHLERYFDVRARTALG